tara:strand:+ start:1094 stop:1516 length:423 start_codon:yes stop_codon:yes gene_type:complete
MLKKLKFALILIITSILLSQCAGTGTKTIPTISSNSGGTNLYFKRPSAFIAGGVLTSVIVNGSEIGKLGNGEFIQHRINSGNFTVKLKATGLGGIGMGGDSISGTGSNEGKFFYIISAKQGLFSSKFQIQETTENGFKNN